MKVTLSIDSKKSIEIGHIDLAMIIICLNNDKRHGKFFSRLFNHPASEVRSEVATRSFLPLAELECLSRDTSIDVVQNVANNKRALKYFEAPLILKMISRDVSVATAIAYNLDKIRESARDEVIEALLEHTDPTVIEIAQQFEEDSLVDDIVDDANEDVNLVEGQD